MHLTSCDLRSSFGENFRRDHLLKMMLYSYLAHLLSYNILRHTEGMCMYMMIFKMFSSSSSSSFLETYTNILNSSSFFRSASEATAASSAAVIPLTNIYSFHDSSSPLTLILSKAISISIVYSPLAICSLMLIFLLQVAYLIQHSQVLGFTIIYYGPQWTIKPPMLMLFHW